MLLENSRGATGGSSLSIRGLSKSIGDELILDGIDLDVAGNEYVSVIGRSGSGKSALLRVIAGFETADAGKVVIDGTDVTGRAAAERGAGVVFQSFALFPHLNVFDNVAFGLRYGGGAASSSQQEIEKTTRWALNLVDLGEFEHRQIQQLSGGQKQRVALARTIVIKPRLLLLDEPLGALDAALRGRMQQELVALQRRLGIPFIHFTGDDTEALAISDRIVVLDRGRVQQVGTPSGILARPESERVARAFDRFNLFRVDQLDAPSVDLTSSRDGTACVLIQSVTAEEPQNHVHAPRAATVAMDVTFIATERLDGKLRNFFCASDGTILQTERDAGETSISLASSAKYKLTWPVADMHVFEREGGGEIAESALPQVSRRREERTATRGRGTAALLALPALIWMTLFLLLPLASIVVVSFWTQTTFAIKPVLTFANWVNFLTTPTYLMATITTLKLWGIVLAASFVLSLPVAIFIGLFVRSRTVQTALIVACIIPFWTSFLIRVLAWRPMLGREGAVNVLLQWLHITSAPLDQLLFSELSVLIGMTQIYSVFVVGPVAYMVSQIDRNLIEAARDLGVNFYQILWRVVLPLSKQGLLVGAIFVSVMVLGEFATSAALSGRQVNLLGNVIVNQVGTLRWALGAVAGCILTLIALMVIGALLKLANVKREI